MAQYWGTGRHSTTQSVAYPTALKPEHQPIRIPQLKLPIHQRGGRFRRRVRPACSKMRVAAWVQNSKLFSNRLRETCGLYDRCYSAHHWCARWALTALTSERAIEGCGRQEAAIVAT
jgi:hypothetical protein